MSIRSEDGSQHLTITAPGHVGVPMGPFTVAVLFKNLPFQAAFIWYAYRPDNFSNWNLYSDGDLWYNFLQWDGNLDFSDEFWRWFVITGDSGTYTPTYSVGEYAATGALSWQHGSFSSTQNFHNSIDRFSIGDEFGNGFRGELACLTSFDVKMDPTTIEATFERSSADILAANPLFFVHWPEADGAAGPFQDLSRDSGGDLNGGVETIRAGTWSASDDPPGFNFLLGRSGKPKIWNGSSFVQHQAKAWSGSLWVPHRMLGHDGTDFIASK